MNADQAERDRLVRFGEDSVPQLLPADAFCAMPMSWTIVRHYVSQCLRAGGAPIDTPIRGSSSCARLNSVSAASNLSPVRGGAYHTIHGLASSLGLVRWLS